MARVVNEDVVAKTWIDVKDLEQLTKDRLDFGFDSIYFRYSEIVEELSWHKELQAIHKKENFNRKAWCDSKRMHFYHCLEQLVNAHPQKEDKKKDDFDF